MAKLYPREPKPTKQETATTRPWRVDYDLAYDGGGAEFTLYYRTYFGARFAAFMHYHVRSWGGSVSIVPNEQ